jgi:hypothetical protein
VGFSAKLNRLNRRQTLLPLKNIISQTTIRYKPRRQEMYPRTLDCLRTIIVVLFCASVACCAEGRGPEVIDFTDGQARCYLDLSGAEALR